jgi:hypothetical protein
MKRVLYDRYLLCQANQNSISMNCALQKIQVSTPSIGSLLPSIEKDLKDIS